MASRVNPVLAALRKGHASRRQRGLVPLPPAGFAAALRSAAESIHQPKESIAMSNPPIEPIGSSESATPSEPERTPWKQPDCSILFTFGKAVDGKPSHANSNIEGEIPLGAAVNALSVTLSILIDMQKAGIAGKGLQQAASTVIAPPPGFTMQRSRQGR